MVEELSLTATGIKFTEEIVIITCSLIAAQLNPSEAFQSKLVTPFQFVDGTKLIFEIFAREISSPATIFDEFNFKVPFEGKLTILIFASGSESTSL